MNKLTYFPTLILLLTVSAAAQVIPSIVDRPIRPQTAAESDAAGLFVVGEVKGTVPSKAVFLATPEYPSDARWAGAEGQVRVEIEIDTEGNVSKASALSGETALHSTAIDAARRSKFRIERNAAGEPQTVTGVLAYEFVIRKATWAAVGWGLSVLEIFPASSLPITAIRKTLGSDWQPERELLDRLEVIRKNSPSIRPPILVRSAPTTISSGQGQGSLVRGRMVLPGPPGDEQKVVASQLVTGVRSRLADDKLAAWQFELGVGLRKAFDDYRNPYARAQASIAVRQFIQSAPVEAPTTTIEALRGIEIIFSKPRDEKQMTELGRHASAILSGK